ncbi:glycoside hydrolase family 18 protein [Luteimonas aquatica]|uniref:glycoside hydrolase family 18 protein n=1 Tax=Luteimonas aquatica TaxID=450364 RepID=UPI001F59E44C|nr:glycoside hydrolase family 18 protein [Luteimonas aquatica]
MLRGFGAFLLVAATAAVFGPASSVFGPAQAAEPARVVGAYYPGGSVDRYPVERIPADKVTHLFYAFAQIRDGRCVAGEAADAHFAALAKLKREHPRLRTLISIGGWSAGGFSDAALTAKSRKRLVASCLALFFQRHRGSFDGIDIDWEYPVYGGPPELPARPQDRSNMTALVREFRRALDALGRERKQTYLVTAALPAGRMQSAGAYDPARSFELDALGKLLDFINLMTYDMGTTFSPVASFNAPLRAVESDPLAPELRRWNNVEGAVDYYLQQGVPASKLVLGVPFYGRGYRVTSDAGDGLYQPYSGTFPAGDYRDIKRKLLGDPQWRQHWDPVAQTPWLFHPKERAFVSYEDPKSIAIRARFARERDLLGVFTWELTADDEQGSLLEAMAGE